MNNYVIQTRAAATATATSFLLSSHGLQESVDDVFDAVSPHIRFAYSIGSVPRVAPVTVRQAAERLGDFETAVTQAYRALARRQQSLEPTLAAALAQNAWDLYEEA
jgi:hypothetical protein